MRDPRFARSSGVCIRSESFFSAAVKQLELQYQDSPILIPAFLADRFRRAIDRCSDRTLKWQSSVRPPRPASQLNSSSSSDSWLPYNYPVSRHQWLPDSSNQRRIYRFQHLSYTKPIVAVDYYGLALGDNLAIEKKLDRFFYLAIEFNDRSAGQFQNFAQGKLRARIAA